MQDRYYCLYCGEELEQTDDVDYVCNECGAQFWGLSYDDDADEETMDEVRGIRGRQSEPSTMEEWLEKRGFSEGD